MEDGVNGSSEAPPGSQVTFKAGWLKKNSGGILGSWKDRYICLHKTQLLVCENEDEQKCIETVELGSYDRCQVQNAFLKRKRHFSLIPTLGSKGQDVKFQARNAEERDAWIQALNEGVNRGKNKILDEVKVDDSCLLEHVTRDRANKGAAKRRPPTRVHLKEVAQAASDGSSRLDLDALDSGVSRAVASIPEDKEPQQEKEPVKIPMPPSKICPSTSKDKLNTDTTDTGAENAHPPSPPPKGLKESVYAREKLLSQEVEENKDEVNPGSSSRENNEEVINTPPKPPPKILSDKMKIKWVGSASDLPEDEIKPAEKGSKDNLMESDSEKLRKLPSPHLKIKTTEMKTHDLNSLTSNLDPERHEETSNLDEKILEHGEKTNELCKETNAEKVPGNIKESSKEEFIEHQIMKEEKDGDIQDTKDIPKESEMGKPKLLLTPSPIVSVATEINCLAKKLRSSSMGDLLSEDSDIRSEQEGTFLHLTKDPLHQVEIRLARGREKTETLLNRVQQGELGDSIEGNGPEVNAETLLNEAVKQLREASEALQVLKESSKSPDISNAERKDNKDLVTLYRRSMP
ncbi:pleckstrin homology domain-containing family O member 2 [Bombina bombina]|uniref:pleckstrin homology domain-containing family O member 2 n=1 Tax=Bombina bombina TaxID=8345 RepID=UPI00235A540E|nr:pleckstrin homology domain-containing family O member 2 [Bombina bombina]